MARCRRGTYCRDPAPRRAAPSTRPRGRMPGPPGPPAGHLLRRAARRAGQRRGRPIAARNGTCRGDGQAGHAWRRPAAGGESVSTYPDHILRVGSQHLAELKRKAAEFERQLWDAHESLEHEMEQSQLATEVMPGARQEAFRWTDDDAAGRTAGDQTQPDVAQAPRDAPVDTASAPRSAAERTSPEER